LEKSYQSDQIENLLRAIIATPQVGTDVQHNLYGYGTVVGLTGSKIIVKFNNDEIGTLTFDKEKAPLAYVR
jgi:hypothetical protein